MKSNLPESLFFPRATFYTKSGVSDHRVGENRPRYKTFTHSERHIQCVWYDPTLRPTHLQTHTGEKIIVDDPGLWNLEAGPDFVGAVLRIGPDQRRIKGDIEIHISPNDWRHHGHANDSRYKNVKAHVTYHAGSLPERELPAGAVQISLKEALSANPLFSFDNIDTTAYPFADRAPIPPCRTELKQWHPDDKTHLLAAAGEERLRQKTERLVQEIAEKGQDQTLYKEILCSLGYKHNKTPFLSLAERFPHDTLREQSNGDINTAYALLLGVSGLLPATVNARWDDETKLFVRQLWDIWWKRKSNFESRTLDKKIWRLSGMRPTNHPIRRMMAAASWFTQKKTFAEKLSEANSVNDTTLLLQNPTDSYWDHRLSLSSKKLNEKTALVGPDRIHIILVNVLIPYWAATHERRPFDQGILNHLPPEEGNSTTRQTAFNLFGPDHTPKLYRNSLRKQGLIQIFHDYCLNDRSRCETCTFPALLEAHRQNRH